MDDFNYPKVDLSTNQKNRHATILIAGNTVLLDAFERAALNGNHSRAKFRDEILKAAGGECVMVNIAGVTISEDCVSKIQAVKGLDEELVSGYSKMVFVLANKFAQKHRGMIDKNDFLQEGMIALLKASVYYLGEESGRKICLITYLWKAVKRRMITLCMKDKLIPIPSQNDALIKSFNAAERAINGPANYEQVIDSMNLTDIERYKMSLIKAALVYRESSIRHGHEDKKCNWVEAVKDFSGINGNRYVKAGHHNGQIMLSAEQNDVVDVEFSQAVDVVEGELDNWHRAVFQGFLSGEHGWREKISAEHINPMTGKCYSRAAPNLALNRVFIRIREEYGELKNFQFFKAVS